jgi:hypothetical protein
MHRSGRGPGLDAPGQVPMRVLQRSQAHGLPEFPHHRQQLTKGSGISEQIIAAGDTRPSRVRPSSNAWVSLRPNSAFRRCSYQCMPLQVSGSAARSSQIFPDATPGPARRSNTRRRSARSASRYPPLASQHARDASVPLWITEGVKKADSLTSRALCSVALQGWIAGNAVALRSPHGRT